MSTFKIGGRVSFDNLSQMYKHYEGIDFPIELALPWKIEDWEALVPHLDEVKDFFKNQKFEILSVHATQGFINEEKFDEWGRQTLAFADELNVSSVTVHPNNVRKKSQRWDLQKHSFQMITNMNKDFNCNFSVETFKSKRRVFRVQEIFDFGLNMTLDTAHLEEDPIIFDYVKKYSEQIDVIHLSASQYSEELGRHIHHLPVDAFCIDLLHQLKKNEWHGCVILEYLPWHHYRVGEDIKNLNKHLFEGEDLVLSPVCDQYKDDPTKWGYIIK